MSYWPGELVQTLSINGNQLSINPGNTVTLPSGGSVSTFNTASISSLTVSSINGVPPEQLDVADWATFPASSGINANNFSIQNVQEIDGIPGQPLITNAFTMTIQTGGTDAIQILNDNSTTFTAPLTAQQGINTNTVGATTVNAPIINTSTINTSTLTANTIIALSTVKAISTLSTTVVDTPQIVNLSSINGLSISSFIGNSGDWSYFPALSTVNIAGYDMKNVADLYGEPNQPIFMTTDGSGSIIFRTNGAYEAMSIDENQQVKVNNNLVVNNLLSTGSINTSSIQAQDININFNFNANSTITSTLNVVNQTNLTNTTVYGNFETKSTIYTSSIAATNLTTTGNTVFTDAYAGTLTVGGPLSVGSTITMSGSGNYLEIGKNNVRMLAPTIGYNTMYLEANLKVGDPGALTGPVIELYPNEFTMGDTLHPISGGISMTAGTTISLYSPLINMLGANIAVGAGAIQVGAGNITVGTSASAGGGLNVYGGKIFAAPSAIGPPSGGNGGIVVQGTADLQANAIRNGNLGYLLIESQTPGTNNISINDITQLTSDGAGMLQQNVGQIIGNSSNFAITNVSSINGSAYPPAFSVPTNLQISTLKVNDGEGTFYTDGTGTITTVSSSVGIANALIQQDANLSTVQRFIQVMNPSSGGNGDVYFTYDVTPPGFTSTTMGQIVFSSTINGGSGGVKITSQFGDAKQLAVNGDGVYASDLIVGSNSDYPITAIVPDLDEWSIFGMSTLSGGGIGKIGIINTTLSNTGQIAFAAPNLSTGNSTRIMYLDSSGSAVGINNGNPQAQLDVGGLNYTSPNSVAIFGESINGTAEVTLQNKSTGSNASAFFFAVENTGGEYAGFGVNSLNLSSLNNTLFEIPGASIQSGTLDCVIGPQSDHSSNSGTYLTYQDGAAAWHINSNGALSFNASYSNNVLSEGNFGTAGSILTTNGAGSTPSWVSSFSVRGGTFSTITTSSILGSLVGPVLGDCTGNNANFSTVNTQKLNLTTPSLATPVTLIDTTVGGNFLTASLDLSPVEYVTTIQNLDINPANQGKAFINLVGSISSVGVHKIPEPGYALDVLGSMKATSTLFGRQLQASTINTQVISTFGSGTPLQLNAAADIELTPAAGTAVNINDGAGPAGNQSGLIRFGETNVSHLGYLGPETFIANNYYPGSYDMGWTTYSGRAVRIEYPVTVDSSFSGGLGKGEVTLPVGLSTLACAQGTYIAFQDSSPGLTHPIWLYSTINGANGQISTVQMGAAQNTQIFVSVLGYV